MIVAQVDESVVTYTLNETTISAERDFAHILQVNLCKCNINTRTEEPIN